MTTNAGQGPITTVVLTTHNINTISHWLARFEGEQDDARRVGLFSGIKWVLKQLGLFESVTNRKEDLVQVDYPTIQAIHKKYVDNKIEALINIGVASGIYWVIEELGVPINEIITDSPIDLPTIKKNITQYRSLTVDLKCSVNIPVDMTNEEFEEKLMALLTADGKFRFHGQVSVRNR